MSSRATSLAAGALAGAAAVVLVNTLRRADQPIGLPGAADVARERARVVAPKAGQDEREAVPPPPAAACGSGVVEPADREARITAAVAGRIAEVLVVEGQDVAAGDPLVRLDADTFRATQAAAEAEVAVAAAELARTRAGLRPEEVASLEADAEAQRARLGRAEKEAERLVALVAVGAAQDADLDRARRQVDADRFLLRSGEARRDMARAGARAEDVAVAAARLRAAEARRDEAAAHVLARVVVAPRAGRVLAIKCRPGEHHAPQQVGAAEPLLLLGDVRRLRARIDIDERDVGKVRAGDPGFVTAPAWPGRRFQGRVVEVGLRMGRRNVRTDDPVERIDTRVREVVLELDVEGSADLVPGMRVSGWLGAAP